MFLRLVDILGIHMGLVTEAPPTAPPPDLETIIAPVRGQAYHIDHF